jgi:rubrerythrin
MNVEEAIITALEYEKKVRDHYAKAAQESTEPKGRNFFAALAREEQGHVEYLTARLAMWRDEQKLDASPLGTTLPDPGWVAQGAKVLEDSKESRDYSDDYRRLFTALKLEDEVSEFYKHLVETLEEPQAKAMFSRFLEIEDGHTAIVQTEVDVLTRTGFFYDFQEFNLEH